MVLFVCFASPFVFRELFSFVVIEKDSKKSLFLYLSDQFQKLLLWFWYQFYIY